MKNTMKKVIGTVMVFALLCGLLAVPSQNAQAAGKDSIYLSDKKVKLKEGDTSSLQLYLRIHSQYLSGSQKTCQWTSSNSKVVKIIKKQNWGDIVGGSGRGDIIEENSVYQFVHQVNFKALKKGNATITAKCGGKTWKAKVTVSEKKISITKKAKVTEGKTATIKLKNNKKKVTWKVAEGKECVEITKKSKTSATIKGIKKGTAKVQAVIAKKKYTCNVTVSASGANPSTSSKPLTTQTPLPTASSTPMPTASPIGNTPMPTASPSENTPMPTVSPSDNTPMPTASPSDNTPMPTASPSENTPIPTASPNENATSTPAPTSTTDVTSDLQTVVIDMDEWRNMNSECWKTVWELEAAEVPYAVTIKEGATEVGSFDGMQYMTSITIPDGVTTFTEDIFSGCIRLSDITIPESVTFLGDASGFRGTKWLRDRQSENPLVIVNNILINGCACRGDVSIPDGVTSIAVGAFLPCYFTWDDIVYYEEDDMESMPYYYDYDEDCWYSNSKTMLTSITIPDSVESIGEMAFYDCENLESITIPDGVKRIEGGTFCYCTSLTSIMIPDSVTYIDEWAFGRCDGEHDDRYPCEFCHDLTEIIWNGVTYDSVESFEEAFGGFQEYSE